GIFSHNISNLLDRKEHAGFVISHHHGDYCGIASQGLPQIFRIEFAALVHLKPRYRATDLREMLAKISHRFMLNARGDDVTPRWVLLEKSPYGPVVRLRTARSENN